MKFLIFVLCIAAASALTPDEIGLVKTTFARIKDHPMDILYTIFKHDPTIQEKFTQFAGKDLDALKGTPPFELHASRIVGFLGEIITDLPEIGRLVDRFVETHKTRGVTHEQLNNFRHAFMSYLKTHVEYTEAIGTAWGTTFDTLYGAIFAKM